MYLASAKFEAADLADSTTPAQPWAARVVLVRCWASVVMVWSGMGL